MPHIIDAIYEDGLLKPVQPLDIREHTRVRITIEIEGETHKNAEQILALARQSYEGLSKEELEDIQSTNLRSESFFLEG